jgi:ATP-dependent Zn protease
MPTSRHREATAYHEAGHFVLNYFLRLWGYPLPQIRRVTIVPKSQVLGCCMSYDTPSFRPDVDESPRTELRIHAEIMRFMAGAAADQRFRGRRNRRGARHDYEVITNLVEWVAQPDEARVFLRWLELRTARLVAAHWRTIELVAGALLARNTLRGAELVQMIRADFTARVSAARRT